MEAQLAVIVVSWNTRDLTLDALRTLFEDVDAHGPSTEVWVVDSDSSDGSAEAIQQRFPRVQLITSDKNLGFAGGNNLALKQIGFGEQSAETTTDTLPQAVYLLNPDTLTQQGATRQLYDALFTLPNAGVVGAQLSYGNGSFQHGAFMFPGLRQLVVELFPVPGRLYESAFNGRYSRQAYLKEEPFPVDHTLGATMMLRREAIQQTGLFDERFFMYCEEIDWSIRIRRAGWEIYAVPKARVIHLGGQSTAQARPESIVNLWRSRMRLFEKHSSWAKLQAARCLIRLGMRRRISQTRQALRQGLITSDEHDSLLAAYQAVKTYKPL